MVQRFGPVDAFVGPGEESREHHSKHVRFYGNIQMVLRVRVSVVVIFAFLGSVHRHRRATVYSLVLNNFLGVFVDKDESFTKSTVSYLSR